MKNITNYIKYNKNYQNLTNYNNKNINLSFKYKPKEQNKNFLKKRINLKKKKIVNYLDSFDFNNSNNNLNKNDENLKINENKKNNNNLNNSICEIDKIEGTEEMHFMFVMLFQKKKKFYNQLTNKFNNNENNNFNIDENINDIF